MKEVGLGTEFGWRSKTSGGNEEHGNRNADVKEICVYRIVTATVYDKTAVWR
jgi:hypothetical protein